MKDNFAIAQRIYDRMESPDYYYDGPEEEIQDVPDCCISCYHNTGDLFTSDIFCGIGIALPVVKRTCKRKPWNR